MAILKTTVALLFILLLVENVYSDKIIGDEVAHPSATIDCGASCHERCILSSRPNLCHRTCETCCARCNCVPPGTSGNYNACPCYRDLTTHGGKHKCP